MGEITDINLENVGVCVKSQDGIVQSQNQTCQKICGHQVGKKCTQGCMLHYHKSEANQAFDLGFKIFRNIDSNGHKVDVVMVNDGGHLTSLLYDKSEFVRRQLDYVERFNLSKAELKVLEKYLLGFSNQETADQLFISRSTLRAHLNNIYKKLPGELKEEILSSHLGFPLKKT